jgi:hypothetical protein
MRIKIRPRTAVLLVLMTAVLAGACSPRELPVFKQLSEKSMAESTKRTDEAIRDSSVLQDIDAECKKIPNASDSKIVWKNVDLDEPPLLTTYYYSGESFERMKLIWDSYFEKLGWVPVKKEPLWGPKALEYRNTEFSVGIFYGNLGDGQTYAIGCQKLAE